MLLRLEEVTEPDNFIIYPESDNDDSLRPVLVNPMRVMCVAPWYRNREGVDFCVITFDENERIIINESFDVLQMKLDAVLKRCS